MIFHECGILRFRATHISFTDFSFLGDSSDQDATRSNHEEHNNTYNVVARSIGAAPLIHMVLFSNCDFAWMQDLSFGSAHVSFADSSCLRDSSDQDAARSNHADRNKIYNFVPRGIDIILLAWLHHAAHFFNHAFLLRFRSVLPGKVIW